MLNRKQKWVLTALSAVLLLVPVFLKFQVKVNAAEGVTVNSDFDPQKFVDSLPPENAFSRMESSSDFEKTFPFYMTPFVNFQVSYNPLEQQKYKAGDQIQVSGNLKYSYDSVDAEMKKLQDKCTLLFNEKSNEEKQKLCSIPEKFTNLPFEKVGVFVQVWNKDNLDDGKKGDYLVDEFYAKEGINLKENQNSPFSFNWVVPTEIKSGNYYFSIFVNQNRNFSLFGFPVNVYSPLARSDFEILNEGNQGVEIDKNAIQINGNDYSQTVPMQNIENSDTVKITYGIDNLNNQQEQVQIKNELYRWTQEDPQNILQTEDKTLQISAKGKSSAEFAFSPNSIDGFYTVRITAQTSRSKSTTDIHFIVKDKGKGKFMFLGLVKNSSNEIFPIFCPRNTQWRSFFNGKIRVTVTENSKPLGTWEKEGAIDPTDGLCYLTKKDEFKNINEQACLKVEGEILDQTNQVVDKSTTEYNCNDASVQKSNNSLVKSQKNTKNEGSSKMLYLVILFFIILVLAIALIYLIKNKKKNNEIQ